MAATDTAGANGMPSPEDLKLYALQQKYTEEAAKRFRPDGSAQFIPLKGAQSGGRIHDLGTDIWVDHAALNTKPRVENGTRYKFVILGGGYAGLLTAARLIDAGLATGPKDLLIVDNAGGFGGTWYWNRYPGLQCDIESYVYMPLLEETGYMPTQKYAPGTELLEHADRIATKWNLHSKALFRSQINEARWDEATKLWNIKILEGRGPGEQSREIEVQADYFLSVSGVFPNPQVPRIPGLEALAAPMFHTARFDYSVTGGSPENPSLTSLEGKRVGILGTGATAIQIIPHLAKYAKELYVFQRTPSKNWERNQKKTDPEEWKKIAYKKGWQRERMANFNTCVTNALKEGQENMVGDVWSKMPSYSAIAGNPNWVPFAPTPEKIGEHIAALLKLDIPATEASHARVDAIVKNPETAAKLKGWYPTWCKRPTFHDEYLPTFNLPHVHLVDTEGKGVGSATKEGLVVEGKEYPLDVLVLSTGFQGPAEGRGDPTLRSGVSVFGRGGRSLNEKWTAQGASTLHGLLSSGFPNYFIEGRFQAGAAGNHMYSIDVWVEHVIGIITKAQEKVEAGSRAVIDVTVQGEEEWAGAIMQGAVLGAAIGVCTPGYLTAEGSITQPPTDPLEMMKLARLGTWSRGMESFADVIDAWRAEGSLRGLEVGSAPV